MKRLNLTRRQIIAAFVLISGVVCLLVLVTNIPHDKSVRETPARTVSSVLNKSTNTAKNAPASSPASQTPEIESSSPACQQFTLAVAKSILGSGASVSPQDSATISDTPDILISTCTYRDSSSSIKLTAYIAKTALGESTNTTMFGSDKPGGVQAIPGYGQTAYWDQAANILFVLKDNNRYELVRTIASSPAALNDVLHAADAIVPKL